MANPHLDVVVVGSSNMDLVAYASRLPAAGETLMGERFQTGYGGKGANQAVAAARLGARVALVARVGDDVFGGDMLRNFAARGIDTAHVTVTPGISSGVAPISVDAKGRNAIIVVAGANGALRPADVDAAAGLFSGAKVVLTQLEVPLDTTARALALGRASGAVTIFNPAPARTDVPAEVLASSDLVCPNETEAATLTGIAVEDDEAMLRAGRALLARGAKGVILTLGARGARYVGPTESWAVSAPTVTAVDTTGAGDCFLGALGYFLARGATLRDAMGQACAMAALSVQHPGTQTSFPGLEALPASWR